jgi:N-acetylglucosaminyldiphosphoundecaprenol N-acetyl-beta-D-mannosaminyltransferase
VDILGVPIGLFTRTRLTSTFLQLLKSRKRGWIRYVNVHAINLSSSIEWFKHYLQDSILTYCNGQCVRIGAVLLGKRLRERIFFSDCIYDVCKIADQTGTGIYLLGAEESVLEKAKRSLVHFYPSLNIRGMYHGYFATQEYWIQPDTESLCRRHYIFP